MTMGVSIHPTSDVKAKKIGEGTRIWQFCVIFENAEIGTDCNICANSLIENDVVLGDHVTVKSGVYIWDGVRIENNVFIGPCVAFTNDKYPRSKSYPEKRPAILIREGASIGANSTLLAGVTIGRYAMIGAGSVVTKDVPDHSVWYGNPAKNKGYVCACGEILDRDLNCKNCSTRYQIQDGRLGTVTEETPKKRKHE